MSGSWPIAYYRQYTLAMLRRYRRIITSGRISVAVAEPERMRPSVTTYRFRDFSDGLIFAMDVRLCIEKLHQTARRMVEWIVLDEQKQKHVAKALRMSLRTVSRQFGRTLDELTTMFLEVGLLMPIGAQ